MLRTELQQKTGLSEIKLDNLLNNLNLHPKWKGQIDVMSNEFSDALSQFIIDNHSRNKVKSLKGDKQPPQTPVESPPSMSGLETVDWTDALSKIGTDETVALSLVKELDLNRDALTVSDVEVLQELAIAESAHAELAQSAQSLHDAKIGSFHEAVDMAVDGAIAEAEAIGQAERNAYLHESLRQSELTHSITTAIHQAKAGAIRQHLRSLGEGQNTGKRPNEIIQELGTAATQRQATASRKCQVRQSRMGNYLN